MSDGTGANFWHSEFVEAQARCKRLLNAVRGGNAINDNAELMEHVANILELAKLSTPDVIRALRYRADLIRAALSDTAQQPDMMDIAVQMVSMAELEDLRERAAKLFDEPLSVESGPQQPGGGPTLTYIDETLRQAIAATIRALPIDPETGGE